MNAIEARDIEHVRLCDAPFRFKRKFKLANIVHRITRPRTGHVICMRRTVFFRSNFIQPISTLYKSRVTRDAISRRLPRRNRPTVRLLVHGHLTLAHFPFLKKARSALYDSSIVDVCRSCQGH